jgi:hypothetical protein
MNFITDANNKLAILGLLPGYNKNIDTNDYKLEKDLIRNISFIDLQLSSYSIGENTKDAGVLKILETLSNSLMSSGKNLYNYKNFSTSSKDIIYATFNKIVQKYLGTSFSTINGVRIIASSDSMATETISNNFGDSTIHQMLTQTKVMKGAASLSKYTNVAKELSYSNAFNMLTTNVASFLDIIKSSALGIQIALPKFFESSNYNHTMSVFFKLTSPSGDKDDIKKLVLDPLKLLMIISSPNSSTGLTYAYPFIYKVVAHGNESIKDLELLDI